MPCAFGVLTVDTMEQALARAGGGKRHQGEDAAHAVLRMAELRRRARRCRCSRVNLYSDTQTRPTEGMRAAIATAEVGDEQRGATRPRNALQERVAELLGHEAALFLPSGHDVQPDRLPAAHRARAATR